MLPAEASPAEEARRIFGRIGVWRAVSLAILLYLFVEIGLRAGRQSITGDEAWNYFLYLTGPVGKVFFGDYDANNHVLYTALAWLSTHWLGVNEFNLRIPSVASAAVYFVTVYRLSTFLFRRSALHPLAVVLLAGNPYVLDFFTVARGYGLALAFFTLALLNVLFASRESNVSNGRLLRIGGWSAVAVCANLGLLFPVGALFVALTAVMWRGGDAGLRALWTAILRIVRCSFGPFIVFSFCVLVMPLHTAHKDSFYFGSESWPLTIQSLVTPSLFHNGRAPLFNRWPALFWSMMVGVEKWFVPVVALLVAALTIAGIIRKRNENKALLVSGLTFSVTILLLMFAHVALQVKLPIMRTGIYFLMLLPLTLLSLLNSPRRSIGHWTGLAFIPVLIFWAVLYVPQWTERATSDWGYDASTRDFAKAIEVMRAYSGATNIKVGGSWIFEPALNFYRLKFGYTQWQPVPRNAKLTDPADYYVIADNERAAIQEQHLRVILDDKISHAVLAVGTQPCAH